MYIDTAAPYHQEYQFSVRLGKEQVQLVTKPSLLSWKQASVSSQLFFENAAINPGDTVLLYGCHLGPLAVSLARKIPSLQVLITDINHTALEMTRLTLAANHIHSIDLITAVDLPQEMHQKYRVIFIQLPKGRQLARRWLVQAFHALDLEGSLYLGGANSSGIQSVIKDAQALLGDGRVKAYKKGNRIAQFVKRRDSTPLPDWAYAPGIAPGRWVEYPINLSGQVFCIRSLPGIFSFDRLDEGTEMLLNCADIIRGTSVLDVGCGYGVVGLYATVKGAQQVHFTDDNLLAVAACKATLAVNNINNAQVFAGDLLEPVASFRYDLILSNPPFHAGQAVNHQIAEALIAQSYQALHPGGRLIIVANRFLRYGPMINAVFANASTLAETGKFHVLCGLKSR